MGTKILIGSMLAVLALAVFGAYQGWTGHSDGGDMPAGMYIALGLGTLFTLLVGCGLMALVFFSSRQGYDEPPDFKSPERREGDA
jgi:hypothetical protein